MTNRSAELFTRAKQVIPGGVNSPVRAFSSVGGEPLFIREASGAILTDADGRDYVDYVGSWGPMILGHAHPAVVQAVQEAAARGTSYGAPTEGEVELAELIAELVPSMEVSRLVSSGTEATMAAIRLARGVTQRDLVVKCIGGYHGGADYLLVRAGSGAATLGAPDSAGVPSAIAETTRLVPYNDLEAVSALFRDQGDKIAAVIVEPVAGNMGCVPPNERWLAGLRTLTSDAGALLVFDEVMTGFRVALGGAQERYGVQPDLTCLGKIVGGGLPVGAYGGRREIMDHVAPVGPVYQAGTLSGNPLAVAAGLTTLRILREPGTYDRLEAIAAQVEDAAREALSGASFPWTVQRVGAMLTVFFHSGSESGSVRERSGSTDSRSVRGWDDADRCDRDRFARWHQSLLAHGVYWPPSQFEAAFVSLAHDGSALARTAEAMRAAM